MATITEQALKAKVADAMKYGVTGALIAALMPDYSVERFDEGPLYVQYRVTPRTGGAPRYFLVKVSEPL